MLPTVRTAALLLAFLALGACQHEPQRTDTAGSVAIVKPPAGVAAAHPIAVEAGLEILRAGGSAVDAAVAVQAAQKGPDPVDFRFDLRYYNDAGIAPPARNRWLKARLSNKFPQRCFCCPASSF